MINRRFAVVALLLLAFVWSIKLLPIQDYSSEAWRTAKQSFSGGASSSSSSNIYTPSTWLPATGGPSPADMYFEQIFSVDDPADYDFSTVAEVCEAANWDENEAYINCVGMNAGMTTIMSQVKVCLKMAIETGSHLVLPSMPLRDSKDLLNFNFLNQDAYMPYDKWYDADHLRKQMARVCPRMKIIHPDDLGKTVVVENKLSILCREAVGYQHLHSYFWVGRPYKTFFNHQFPLKLQEVQLARLSLPPPPAPTPGADVPPADAPRITVVDVDSGFMIFRITDDPTRRDLRMWTELAHMVRFREDVRTVVDRIVKLLPPTSGYYGVHYRAENDSIWSTAEHQLGVDLDALDSAWAKFGSNATVEKPLVYLACGDAVQVENFVKAGGERGWEVTHKWRLADEETKGLINAMPFDFQGAIDMGLMVRSGFFVGVQGSAFSSTVANQRDPTGRYRGSSLDIPDGGARTHLFNDLDAQEYACCL